MTPKEYLSNRAFCPAPWVSVYINPDGTVQNCSCSSNRYGSINDQCLEDITKSPKNINLKEMMLSKQFDNNCATCYDYEKNNYSINTPSQRTYYLKTLKTVPLDTYNSPENFSIHQIDLRWRNTCNQACVYCDPGLSSKWADELGVTIKINEQARIDSKNYIYKHIEQIKDVYLAGGEPLLINDNIELLTLLYEKNPDVKIRINTNLSTLDNKVYKLLQKFKNLHWIVSVDSIEKEYEYIRFPGNWDQFTKNLKLLQATGQTISFNMVWFVLNSTSIFECMEYLYDLGFHENSIVVHPLESPPHLNINNLPNAELERIRAFINDKINAANRNFLLYKSLVSMLQFIKLDYAKNLEETFNQLSILDARRGLNSQIIFENLYNYK